jgi:hypothetical protein
MDQFGWSAEKAIVIIAITMIISSVVSTSLFFLIPVGAKYFDERILLIVFGIVPYTLGRLFFFPFASEVTRCSEFKKSSLNTVKFQIHLK